MDENKNYKDPQREGDDNDTYDPYEEYVKDKVHEDLSLSKNTLGLLCN